MRNAFVLLFLGLAFSFAATSCSTPRRSDYLSDYDRLEKGNFLERYFVDRASVGAGNYTRLVLGSISADEIQDKGNVTRSECVQWLDSSLLLSKQLEGEVIVLSAPRAGNSARLDLSISEMNPGSGNVRMLAGEFGAGHAWVQIEGIVTDPRSGAILASFAERRRSSGAIGFKDMEGDSGAELIQTMISEIGVDIRLELGASFGFQ